MHYHNVMPRTLQEIVEIFVVGACRQRDIQTLETRKEPLYVLLLDWYSPFLEHVSLIVM
jgi:hypothetical protein